jgi:hypothetical protein
MRQVLAPEWLRVRDAADYSGISQTELFRLCLQGEIQSVHKLRPGQVKGIRLINKPSLDAYVRSFLPGGPRFQVTRTETNAVSSAPNRSERRSKSVSVS